MFHFQRLRLENFRCFNALDLALEDDLTILSRVAYLRKTLGRGR